MNGPTANHSRAPGLRSVLPPTPHPHPLMMVRKRPVVTPADAYDGAAAKCADPVVHSIRAPHPPFFATLPAVASLASASPSLDFNVFIFGYLQMSPCSPEATIEMRIDICHLVELFGGLSLCGQIFTDCGNSFKYKNIQKLVSTPPSPNSIPALARELHPPHQQEVLVPQKPFALCFRSG